ncbi:MAG: ASPIC/UnbV domain-containing protein [Flavobacteriales bacterium]|nr:ASPIC/UnbV domain-containing protein [Flavobacteriales bacterium]
MSSLNAHFGFGTDSVITGVTVHWPSVLLMSSHPPRWTRP